MVETIVSLIVIQLELQCHCSIAMVATIVTDGDTVRATVPLLYSNG